MAESCLIESIGFHKLRALTKVTILKTAIPAQADLQEVVSVSGPTHLLKLFCNQNMWHSSVLIVDLT